MRVLRSDCTSVLPDDNAPFKADVLAYNVKLAMRETNFGLDGRHQTLFDVVGVVSVFSPFEM
jgi:hypothetical protein